MTARTARAGYVTGIDRGVALTLSTSTQIHDLARDGRHLPGFSCR